MSRLGKILFLKQWVGNTGVCEGVSEGISTAKQTNIQHLPPGKEKKKESQERWSVLNSYS